MTFQLTYDDRPGHGRLLFDGGLAVRLQTADKKKRSRLVTGFPEDKLELAARPVDHDADGRFRLTGLIADLPFTLRVLLTKPPDNLKIKGRIVVGMVEVAHGTAKSGAEIDLGDVNLAGK